MEFERTVERGGSRGSSLEAGWTEKESVTVNSNQKIKTR